MRKQVFGRQFKRDVNERKALFKNLLTSLVLEERMKTSTAKAKAIKGAADKLITKAKKGGTVAYRLLEADVNHNAVVKLIDDLGPRFMSRQGGYTRIIKIGNRVADNAEMSMIEWTEKPAESVKVKAQSEKQNEERKDGKKQAAKKVEKKAEVEKVTKKNEKERKITAKKK